MAANLGRLVVTVWSSKKEMARLHSFDLDDHDGMEDRVVENIKATGTEIIALVRERRGFPEVPYQLVVLQEGEHNWENKILESFTLGGGWCNLAVDKDWRVVVGYELSRPLDIKVKLWKEELFRRDIELPGWYCDAVDQVALHSPFLVVSGRSDISSGFWIKVFALASGNLKEDFNTIAPLIKTVQIPGFYVYKLLCSGHFLGCQLLDDEDVDNLFSNILFEKKVLLDGATLPEQTHSNRIPMPRLHVKQTAAADMNATSLVFIQSDNGKEYPEHIHLCKKDFWMSENIIA